MEQISAIIKILSFFAFLIAFSLSPGVQSTSSMLSIIFLFGIPSALVFSLSWGGLFGRRTWPKLLGAVASLTGMFILLLTFFRFLDLSLLLLGVIIAGFALVRLEIFREDHSNLEAVLSLVSLIIFALANIILIITSKVMTGCC